MRKYRYWTILVCFAVTALVLIGTASAKSWYVDGDSGSGTVFTRIQDAVNAASDDYAIIVNCSTYYENVNINKQNTISVVDITNLMGSEVKDVWEKDVVFDISQTAVIGDKLCIKGAANTGSKVDIFVDDVLYTPLNNIALDENGQFEVEVIASSSIGMGTPGTVKLKAWIDCPKNPGDVLPAESAHGETGILLILMTEKPVHNLNTGADFSTIQAAIDDPDTFDGHTIIVDSGSYNEDVKVHKRLILDGNDTGGGDPVVDARGSGSAITLSAEGIMLEGFTVTNSGGSPWEAGIKVTSNNNTIANNTAIQNTKGGIHLAHSNNNTVINNIATQSHIGIKLTDARNNTVANNSGSINLIGIYLWSMSHDVRDNVISNNIFNHGSTGISLHYAYQNRITDNKVNNNGAGIELGPSNTKNTITTNTADANTYGILVSSSSWNNVIYLNNFINNIYNGNSSNSTNIWNSTTEITYTYNGLNFTNNLGNYWDDYNEKYPDADGIDSIGIWNTPYCVNAENDNYPLTEPFENYTLVTEEEPYTNMDVGVTSNITIANSSDLIAYLPPEYTDSDISNSVVLNIDVTDITPDTTDAAYTDITINIGELDLETYKVFKTDIGFLPEVEDITTRAKVSGEPAFSRDLVNKTVTVRLYVGDPLLGVIPAAAEAIFDMGEGTYPSIKGTHNGTIKPSRDINVSKMYTYPCAGTGGHSESIELYENETLIASGVWEGYKGDVRNITIENETGASYVMLLKNHEYNYTTVTGSYPQIIHAPSKEVTGGTISCTSFVDANGKVYYDWIPAIRLE